MNKRKIYALSYFLSRSFFLGYGYSVILSNTNKDSWICFILGTLIGICFIYAISKIKEKMLKLTIKEYLSNHKILKYLILTIFFIFNILIMSQLLFVLETFAASFFLINSPTFFILLPILFLLFRITVKGWSTIGRIAEIFIPISLVIVIFSLSILTPYGTIDKFLPIMTQNNLDMIKSTFMFAFYTSAPFLLLLNVPMQDHKLIRKYLFGTITIILIGILIIAVLGPNLIQIYRYPEYMILKKIKVFQFLEKIENIISITWILDVFITLSVIANNIRLTIPKKKNTLLFSIILIILFFLVIYLGKIYFLQLQFYAIFPLILGGFEILIILLFFLKNRFKKRSQN